MGPNQRSGVIHICVYVFALTQIHIQYCKLGKYDHPKQLMMFMQPLRATTMLAWTESEMSLITLTCKNVEQCF